MQPVKIDFHIHSRFSSDSSNKIRDIIGVAKSRNLQGIFICDHNNFKIKKHLKSNKIKDFFLLTGMEIKTEFGEIITCFHSDNIRSRNFYEVLDEVRDKNGYVIIPHPFDSLRSSRLDFKRMMELIKNYKDILLAIEVMNSRCIFNRHNRKALKFANKMNLGKTAGSDAHFRFEIGNSYTIFENVSDENDIIEAIKKKENKIEGKLSIPLVHVFTVLNKNMKKMTKKLLGKEKLNYILPI